MVLSRNWQILVRSLLTILAAIHVSSLRAEPAKYCRFQVGDTIAYGIVEGQTVRQLDGDLFGTWSPANKVHSLGDVTLLVPCEPSQVLAMAGNYRSHVTASEDAKGSDTFGPCGPFIVSGLNYDNLLLQLRVNGEVRQKERTNLLIHDVATIVSVISAHVTLQPGDLIFTGTSGKTGTLSPGDVVEVELEGTGILRNHVMGEK